MKLNKMWIYIGAAVITIVIAVPACITALTIDDWSRDLSTNVAETSLEATDKYLQPLQTYVSKEHTIQSIGWAIEELTDWAMQPNETTTENNSDQAVVIHATRTTAIMRYVDDVTITVTENEEGCLIHVKSESRVGKGDLGQNPRNIKQFMKKLRQHAELFER